MGWLFYARPRNVSVREHLDGKLNWENENGSRRVLKSAMVGATYYAAVEHVMPHNKRIVWAAVYLTKSHPKARDGMTFGYKDMDETVGPCESKCPPGILDLLTEAHNEYAREWRERCRVNAKRKQRKPKVGQTIVLGQAIKFSDGFEGSHFRVEQLQRRNRMMTAYRSLENNRLYRLTNISELPFRVEEGSASLTT